MMKTKCFSRSCCAGFSYGQDDSEGLARSRMIDKELLKEKRQIKREVKLLLLGAGESGKSTFLKQMKIIHGHNFEQQILDEYKETIYSNVIKGMKVLIDARDKLNINWGDEDNAVYADHVFNVDNHGRLSQADFSLYASSVHALWSDRGIRTAFERRGEFQLSDGMRYLLDNVGRIATKDYIPTHQDILHARKATKGVTEFTVDIHSIPFRFVDVGGQRSQRQKWLQCFESVTSILFLVSSSEYDQVLLEDKMTNRLVESVNIFDSIANNRSFIDVSMILFLNKTDVLSDKLERAKELYNYDETAKCVTGLRPQDLIPPSYESAANGGPVIPVEGSPISSSSISSDLTTDSYPQIKVSLINEFFPDFKSNPFEVNDVQKFMLNMFDSVRRERKKPMYHHMTTAVDTENIKYVFNAVRNSILQKNIHTLMLQ